MVLHHFVMVSYVSVSFDAKLVSKTWLGDCAGKSKYVLNEIVNVHASLLKVALG